MEEERKIEFMTCLLFIVVFVLENLKFILTIPKLL